MLQSVKKFLPHLRLIFHNTYGPGKEKSDNSMIFIENRNKRKIKAYLKIPEITFQIKVFSEKKIWPL
jgi:hypothetical protein